MYTNNQSICHRKCCDVKSCECQVDKLTNIHAISCIFFKKSRNRKKTNFSTFPKNPFELCQRFWRGFIGWRSFIHLIGSTLFMCNIKRNVNLKVSIPWCFRSNKELKHSYNSTVVFAFRAHMVK